MTQLYVIDRSYIGTGAIHQAVDVAARSALEAGAATEDIRLRDFPIEFCRNCRQYTQVPGEALGECVHHDGMRELIDNIEGAGGFILASPTNFHSETAIFKSFMERLAVYTYWPWGSHAPQFRKNKATKSAILIASSALPVLSVVCLTRQLNS